MMLPLTALHVRISLGCPVGSPSPSHSLHGRVQSKAAGQAQADAALHLSHDFTVRAYACTGGGACFTAEKRGADTASTLLHAVDMGLCLQGCWGQAEEQAGAAGGRRAGTAQGCSGCSCRGPHGLLETRLAAAAALVLAGSLFHLLHARLKLLQNDADATSAYMRLACA